MYSLVKRDIIAIGNNQTTIHNQVVNFIDGIDRC